MIPSNRRVHRRGSLKAADGHCGTVIAASRDGREKEAVSAAEDCACIHGPRKTEARREIFLVRIELPSRNSVDGRVEEPSDQVQSRHLNRRRRGEIEIGYTVVSLGPRRLIIVPDAQVHCQLRRNLPVVLEVDAVVAVQQILPGAVGRDTPARGRTQQKARCCDARRGASHQRVWPLRKSRRIGVAGIGHAVAPRGQAIGPEVAAEFQAVGASRIRKIRVLMEALRRNRAITGSCPRGLRLRPEPVSRRQGW